MQLQTILNRIHRHPSFVYGKVRLVEDGGDLAIEAEIRARANGRPKCSKCGEQRPGYDTLKPRRFEFIPILGMAVYFVYPMRRVDCPDCGIVVESVPWGSGKQQATTTYAWFLASWAKRLSWSEVAEVFHTSWAECFVRSRLCLLDWTEEECAVMLEAASLSDDELGAFVRGKGLRQGNLIQWRQDMLTALGAAKARSSRPSAETRRIRELERELARKEKALAEAAALLLLKKKVQVLWGDEDDTTAVRKGRRS